MADQELLGRDYVLHERLGQGPVGVLRRATRRDGGPPLAVRLLRPDLAGDREVRDVFRQEAATLSSLRHESIVAIQDVVIEPRQVGLVMELVDGTGLRRLVSERGGWLPPEEARAVAAQVAAGLAAGHAQGIVHLDLRPEQLLLPAAAPVRVKISDFGVATMLLDAGQDPESIGLAGAYTAPEIRRGGAPTSAADVFALGVVLAELVTGVRPGPGDVPDLPGELRAVVQECLAVDPRVRPAASAVAARLQPAGATPVAPIPPAAPAPAAAAAAPPTASPPPMMPPAPPTRPPAPPIPPAAPPIGTIPPPVPAPVPLPARRRPVGPVVTLLVGLVMGIVLGALSANAASDDAGRRNAAADQTANQAAGVAQTATATPPPTQAASPTPAASPTLAAASPTPAPAAPAPPTPDKFRAAYAGQVDDGTASVAIAIRDGGAIAYLCDGNRLEAWLLGTALGGNLNLTGPRNASLTGTYDKNSVTGLITAGGRTWTLQIRVAKKPSGLYRSTAQVRGARVVTGWIVLPGGRQVGMSNAGGVETPAPPLDLANRTATVSGVQVTAMEIDGMSTNGFPP
jgi:hypothetical protein